MPKVLKVYADKSHYQESDRYHLNDILKSLWNDLPRERRIEIYGNRVDFFQSVDSIDEADYCLLPMKWNYYLDRGLVPMAKDAVETGKEAGKKVIIFSGGDFTANIPFTDVIVFESSGYRSRRTLGKNQLFAFPGYHNDYLQFYREGKLAIRKKGLKPVVGFCGQAGGSPFDFAFRQLMNWLKRGLFTIGLLRWEPPPFETTRFRNRILSILSTSYLIESNFLIRARYRAGVTQASKDPFHSSRLEFVNNLINSDYIVCIRGGGNFSIRFYEALCMGRIPIFVDTDCILPFDHMIDYRKYCVWVDQKEIPMIAEKVADFHASISPGEFEDLQVACRQLWVDRLKYR